MKKMLLVCAIAVITMCLSFTVFARLFKILFPGTCTIKVVHPLPWVE